MDNPRWLRALGAGILVLLAATLTAGAGGEDLDADNLSPLQRLAMEAAQRAAKETESIGEELPDGIISVTDTSWQEQNPCWGPDSETLYYSLRGTGMNAVVRLAPGAAEPDTITAAQYWNCDQPDISPDGKYLAYRSKKSGQLAIWILRLEDKAEGKLTPEAEPRESSPAWSPSGMTLFYERQIPGSENSKAVSCRRTGESMKVLSDDRGNHSFPRVSPDGQQVAWLHRWKSLSKIVIVNTEISAFTKDILLQGARIISMDWLPDGRHFVVACQDEVDPQRGFDLGILDMDSGEIQIVADLGSLDNEPRLSPDGTKVVFSSDLRGQQDLFIWEVPDSLRGGR